MKIGWLLIAMVALFLAMDKVQNEHKMTEMYARQAAALEEIASSMRFQGARKAGHVIQLNHSLPLEDYRQ